MPFPPTLFGADFFRPGGRQKVGKGEKPVTSIGGLTRRAPPPPPLPPLPPFPGPYDESVSPPRLHRLCRLSLAAYSEMSIDCRQDRPDLLVLKHILSQKVILPGADIRQLLVATERHMAVRIEAGSYTQSVS